jgi:hypothetical protein
MLQIFSIKEYFIVHYFYCKYHQLSIKSHKIHNLSLKNYNYESQVIYFKVIQVESYQFIYINFLFNLVGLKKEKQERVNYNLFYLLYL